MAYVVKYRTLAATQENSIVKLDILENNYVGNIIEYNNAVLELQYIPSSDDPFEPIYASQLRVELDVTNNVADMPNFVTLDDRKYLCKLYKDNVLEWQGWALSDNVQFRFTTGIKIIQFNAICGLGLLDKINFSELESTPTATYKSIIYCLSKALYDIEIQSDIFASVSIYAESMNDRNDEDYFDPFQQSYIQLSGIIKNNEYITSYQLIKDILFSFGCRIFYAKGRWNIVQVNQMALDNPYFTLYDYEGAIIDSGTFTGIINVPTDAIFLDNSQLKIFKKGFNNIISENTIESAENYIFNSTLKLNDTVEADGWVRTNGGSGFIDLIEKPEQENNYWLLTTSGGVGPFAQVQTDELFLIAKNDIISLSFDIIDSTPQTSPSTETTAILIITISNGTQTYFISDELVGDKKGAWRSMIISPNYYDITGQSIRGSFNLDSFPAPISGLVSIGFRLNSTTGNYFMSGNYNVVAKSDLKKVIIKSEINNTKEYNKKVSFPFGVNSNVPGKYSYKGFISDINGNMLVNWYNFERPTDTYYSLAQLMVKNYVIQYRKNIINIDSVIQNLNSGFGTLEFNDTDPSQINVSQNKYLLGNSTINYSKNECLNTLLEVSATDQNATISTVYQNLTEGTTPTTNCVNGVSYEVVSIGDVSYATCEGDAVIVNSGGIGPNTIAGCIQFGSLLPYFGNGTPATIIDISYGGPCG